ncbi:MAG: MFS transporter [Bacillus subtilis]|nr:MFS transporter [Bacillus subtilis]
MSRNKWAYSAGGIGRDMIYQLDRHFLFTYVQYSGLDINAQQFAVIGVLLVIGRVWDAVNDPIMGSIVENTHSRWGKFKPWIFLGAILTAIVVLFMFNFRPTGWAFVVFFGVIYLLWEMAFTLNDIPYWSLLPALAKSKKDRDTMATMVVVFAGVGGILANIIVSLTTVGNMVRGYSMISVTFAIFFVACTCLTVFGVKEEKEVIAEQPENVSIKQMFSVIKNNDQLLWSALALMFYSVGSGLLTALGYNFFYMNLGYDGNLITMFLLVVFCRHDRRSKFLFGAREKTFPPHTFDHQFYRSLHRLRVVAIFWVHPAFAEKHLCRDDLRSSRFGWTSNLLFGHHYRDYKHHRIQRIQNRQPQRSDRL